MESLRTICAGDAYGCKMVFIIHKKSTHRNLKLRSNIIHCSVQTKVEKSAENSGMNLRGLGKVALRLGLQNVHVKQEVTLNPVKCLQARKDNNLEQDKEQNYMHCLKVLAGAVESEGHSLGSLAGGDPTLLTRLLTRQGLHPHHLVAALAWSIRQDIKSAQAQDIASVAVQISGTVDSALLENPVVKDLFEEILTTVQIRVEEFDGQMLADLVWALARAKVEKELLVSIFTPAAIQAAQISDLYELAVLGQRWCRAGLPWRREGRFFGPVEGAGDEDDGGSSMLDVVIGREAVRRLQGDEGDEGGGRDPTILLVEVPGLLEKFHTLAEAVARETQGQLDDIEWWCSLMGAFERLVAQQASKVTIQELMSTAERILQTGISRESPIMLAITSQVVIFESSRYSQPQRNGEEEIKESDEIVPLSKLESFEQWNPKQLARAAQILSWAGVATEKDVQDFTHLACRQLSRGQEGGEKAIKRERKLKPELSARLLAETALQFANAGAQDDKLFNAVSSLILEDLAENSSMKAHHMVLIAVKQAAAGVDDVRFFQKIASFVQKRLESSSEVLSEEYTSAFKEMKDGEFRPTSRLPMLTLFNLGMAVPKATLECPVTGWRRPPLSWREVDTRLAFADPRLPLVVDIGSGLSSFLLWGAKADDSTHDSLLYPNDTTSSQQMLRGYNWLGVDLQPAPVRRAKGLATRLQIQSRVQFLCGEAREVLDWLRECYPGPVRLVTIQFPTPFRQDGKEEHGDGDGDGSQGERKETLYGKTKFMVQAELVSQIADIIHTEEGALLLKSQIERVADTMKNQFMNAGMTVIERSSENDSADGLGSSSPKLYGQTLSQTMYSLPFKSETEVACAMSGRPIHTYVLAKETS